MNINDIEVKNNSKFIKVTVGANPVKVVSSFEYRKVTYKDGSSDIKYSCLCIDRKDGEIRLADFGKGIFSKIKELANTPGYEFTDMPTYDLIINRQGTGMYDTKYTVTASRQDTPLTEEETKKVFEAGSLKEFIARLESRQPQPIQQPPKEILTEETEGYKALFG